MIAPRILASTALSGPLPRADGAGHELVVIARIELARLLWLAEADARRAEADVAAAHGGPARHSCVRWSALRRLVAAEAVLDARAWLRRARHLLALLDELDGARDASSIDWPGRAWLTRQVAIRSSGRRTRCAAEPRERVERALAVLYACDCVEGRVLLADARLEAGEPLAALDVCRALLGRCDRTWPALLRQQAWRALADAHEACGNDRLALSACTEALRAGDRSAWPAQHGLLLALALGDPTGVRRCARALAACESADRRVALDQLRARVQRLRAPLPWRPPFEWRRAFTAADSIETNAAEPAARGVRAERASAAALARVEEVCAALARPVARPRALHE